MRKYFSVTDVVVILITSVLFIVALFVKGLTQDLLLEAGVLLVSIKIIMMNYKNALSTKTVLKELGEIKEALSEIKNNK